MTAETVYKNTVGTVLVVDCGEVITGATDIKLLVMKPDETEVEWNAVIDGETKIRYIVKSGDLDQVGLYKVQASLTLGSWSGRGNTASFRVEDNFE